MHPPQPPDEDDAAIIERSRRRPESFAAIFDRHAVHIHRYLARRRGRQAADDWSGRRSWSRSTSAAATTSPGPHARPWLYGIATNLVRQHHREEAREYRLRANVGAEPNPDGHADLVVTRVAAQAMHGPLAAALAGMSAGDRDVLLLVAWEGLAYDEVALALAIPAGRGYTSP